VTMTREAPLPGAVADAAYVFKVATEPWEIDQIHRLNHQTFA